MRSSRPQRYTVPKKEERPTPYGDARKYPDQASKLTLHYPYCCFPAYRNDGKPSQVRVLKPEHPIVRGVPGRFEIPQTEMYDEPFHVPEPDEVILEECWAGGEWFRSGAIWQVGKGGCSTSARVTRPTPSTSSRFRWRSSPTRHAGWPVPERSMLGR